ncbi:addiction module protein [Candidatus Methylobacter oryzae]|uniref:Addiction module protein n=1 Tax=Candidatus Methylobacter oryzae TaxID=2497749 RepID=A0ABY3CB38_9GAMM|nr:addiction module protein [Candidatus Methylobacter oryzae]TRW95895.1 addiction module protein [Candidatus Methylobacter oryzae]
MNSKQLFDQALSLPLADRAALVEQLLASLDQPDPQIDELITIEAERRIDAYDNGEMRSIPADQVFSRLESN